MTQWVRIVLVMLFLAGVTGCGQKGPLYLPDNTDTTTDEETTETAPAAS